MPQGIKPRVNEAREFLEIAKDFKDPKELIREALSNSWDAHASKATIKFELAKISGTQKRKIMVEITDDGDGMSSARRTDVSEIEGFFNLGDSLKPAGSIGSKGHGTKIFYKSGGIKLQTWKNGRLIEAQTEVPPWETLQRGHVPTYRYDESDDPKGRGTKIYIDGFQAKQSEFKSLDNLIEYVKWYTVAGSFGHYFTQSRRMSVELKPLDSTTPATINFGFEFPKEDLDISEGTEDACKIFGPEIVDCGTTEDGKKIQVELVGALLGENHRGIVPHTYSHMGLWLAKDFIRIERKNELLEAAMGGQYWYRAFLIFANCQQFDLTANRNNIRTDQEEYDLAIVGIGQFCEKIWKDEFVQAYFNHNKVEEEEKNKEEEEEKQRLKVERLEAARKERINKYQARQNLNIGGLAKAPRKEPRSEAETALLLQAMISANHPAIDFIIGDYNTSFGTDMIVEKTDKGIHTLRWVELVHSLDNLGKWGHPPDGYHMIVCYQLGSVGKRFSLSDGTWVDLMETKAKGRYALMIGKDMIDVYVLRDLLVG